MEEDSHQSVSDTKHKKAWPVKKVLLSLAVTVILFGAGVAVGRGDINLKGLSVSTTSAPVSALDYSSVNQVYSILKKDYDGNLNTNNLTEGIKSGLVAATGDPYTEYFSPKDAKAFNDQLTGSITGIGAELGSDNGNIVIVSPLDGFPAQKAGIKPKDIVAAIDGKTTVGMSVSTAVSKIRGQEGTKVTLTLVRNGGDPFSVSIVRQKITVPSVKSEVDGQIGYMKINQFTDDTSSLAQKAAEEFKAKGVKAIVLDMRGNPGGYLSAAVNVSSLWLDNSQTVVQERRGATVISNEMATGNNILKGIPTVVLINEGSASASEITAGALHDNIGATLMGEKSFGKGSVQQVEQLPGGSEMKVTIARWYTPKGKNIDKQGIVPDKIVANDDASLAAGKDPQKDAAFALASTKL